MVERSLHGYVLLLLLCVLVPGLGESQGAMPFADASMCGDSVRERGEICDDGNQVEDDACTTRCRRPVARECTSAAQCDSRICRDGACTACGVDTDCPEDHGCRAGRCMVVTPSCGNAIVDPGEQCDDGNRDDADACSHDCLLTFGQRCTYDFQCETGRCETGTCTRCRTNDACPDTHACINGSCLHPSDVPYTPNYCGNAILEPGEACDLGLGNSNAPNAACRLDCSRGRCGDRVLDRPVEACDDGNRVSGDGCSALCLVEEGATLAGTVSDQTAALFQEQSTPSVPAERGPLDRLVQPRTDAVSVPGNDQSRTTLVLMLVCAVAGVLWIGRRR